MIATGVGWRECVELLLRQPCMREQLQAATGQGWTALMIACNEGHSECVGQLLAAGHAAAQVQATTL